MRIENMNKDNGMEREGDDENEEEEPESVLLLPPLAIHHLDHRGRCGRHADARHLKSILLNWLISQDYSISHNNQT